MRLLSQEEVCDVFNVSRTTIEQLINADKIPYKVIGDSIKFNPSAIGQWAQQKPELKMDDQKYIERLRKQFLEKYPESMRAIQEYAKQFADPWVPKKFYLRTLTTKKLGKVYYVRYLDNGKLVPTNWSTHTNDKAAAENFAIENRERLLKKYYSKAKDKRKPYKEMYSIFRVYYSENSPYLQIDAKRGRSIADKSRVTYHNFIMKQFIPFLRKEKIKSIEEIDTPLLSRLQNYLLINKKQKAA
jgi:excisionase family DNA binding protein